MILNNTKLKQKLKLYKMKKTNKINGNIKEI